MRKVTKEDLKKGLEVRWYEHGRSYVVKGIEGGRVYFHGYPSLLLESVLDNCYVPKNKVMRYIGGGYNNLTNSKNYNVEEGGSGYYHLIDNDGVKVAVIKSLFEDPSLQREAEEFGKKITDHVHDYCKEAFGEHRIKPTALPLERCKLVAIKKNQIGGTHYNKNDPIQFARDNYSQEQLEGFFRINVDKYVARYPNKNGLEDLYKARHYLDMLIDLKEKQNAE